MSNMKRRKYKRLVDWFLENPGKDITIHDIYRLVCNPPYQDKTSQQLFSVTARPIGLARAELEPLGFVVVLGDLRYSYRCVRRRRVV